MRFRIFEFTSFVIASAIALGLIVAPQSNAQSQKDASTQAAFDAASVKPCGTPIPGITSAIRGGPETDDPGRISYTRISPKLVLMKAFGVLNDQIVGPAWLDDSDANCITITATMPPGTTTERFQSMLQSLLAERFHLTVHHQTKDFPGYELLVAGDVSKLKEAAPEEKVASGAKPFGPPPSDRNGFPVRRPGSTGTMSSSNGMIRSSNRMSMTQFVSSLGLMVNESNRTPEAAIPRVADKTGLTGTYEFTLEFAGKAFVPASLTAALQSAMAAARLARGETSPAPVVGDPDGAGGPSLFTALEKQLGLKLQKVKNVPVDIVVVDHIDKSPTEN